MAVLDRVQLPRCGHCFHYECLAKHLETWDDEAPSALDYDDRFWFQCPACRVCLITRREGGMQVFVNVNWMNGSGVEGSMDMLEDLFEKAWYRDHPEEAMKASFLSRAAFGDIEGCAMLFDEGADIDSTYEPGHQTSLMLAVLNNNVELVKFLVERGADVRIRDDYGKTALDMAEAHNCSREIKNILNAAMV
ncbi:hypothetical protein HK102_007065 [Quaeritorhiza haematococci]|nr:hypothetical protein HK102_007065 [Quaeritorhiza haematococci]